MNIYNSIDKCTSLFKRKNFSMSNTQFTHWSSAIHSFKRSQQELSNKSIFINDQEKFSQEFDGYNSFERRSNIHLQYIII